MTSTVLSLPSTSTKSLLLIILLCDTPIDSVKETYGTYHTIFSKLFENSLNSIATAPTTTTTTTTTKTSESEHHTLTIESYDVVSSIYPTTARMNQANALLITGSASSAHLPLPWINSLISFISPLPTLYPTLKLIGICFGHQIMARAFGTTVELNEKGWEVGVRHIDLSEIGIKVFGGKELAIHQMHRDHVPLLPNGFKSLGSTPICNIHGMIKFVDDDRTSSGTNVTGKGSTTAATKEEEVFDPTKIQVITLQGHPEFSPDIVTRIVNFRQGTTFSPEEAEINRKFAKERDEGIRIGRVFLSILGV